MGKLIDGVWHDVWYNTKAHGGRFVRKASSFRDWIRADGSTPFAPETGRYHVYASLACPWAHRVLIVRRLKGLEDAIGVSLVEPLMLDNGWTFSERFPDHLYGSRFLYERYVAADPAYTGRVTTPALWDRSTETIVSNESSEIIRMLNSEFASCGGNDRDLCPQALCGEIDAVNDMVYPNLNNGVYRAGFATSQEAYDNAVGDVFRTLDLLEERLADGDYLVGNQLTEADIRVFTTLIRFDAVYHGHFKCNLKQLRDYPNLHRHTVRIYELPEVKPTVDIEHIKRHYYGSHATINPSGIVPGGPSEWP